MIALRSHPFCSVRDNVEIPMTNKLDNCHDRRQQTYILRTITIKKPFIHLKPSKKSDLMSNRTFQPLFTICQTVAFVLQLPCPFPVNMRSLLELSLWKKHIR